MRYALFSFESVDDLETLATPVELQFTHSDTVQTQSNRVRYLEITIAFAKYH